MFINGYNTHKSFESIFTNEEAINVLKTLTQNSFAQDLLSKPTLSQNQMYWVHKIANDTKKPASPTYNYVINNILALFDRVSEKLKFPKLRFTLTNALQNSTSHLTLARMSNKSKNPGAIAVVYKDIYRGCINRDGTSSVDFPVEVKNTLIAFEQDPIGFAKNSGRLCGSCMFCGLTLEDERSTQVGYGPVCAKHWGLPWG